MLLVSSTMKRRSYRQNCALALAGDLIGERWSLLLIRDLLVGPRRFRDLTASLKGMGTNLLAIRLKDLEAADIVERTTQESGAPAYRLTKNGWALEAAVLALVRWGLTFGPENQPGFHHMAEWDLVALKALFQPALAGDLTATVQFRTSKFAGWVSIQDDNVTVGLGESNNADTMVGGTIKDLFAGNKKPEELLLDGSRKTLRQFMAAFALPG